MKIVVHFKRVGKQPDMQLFSKDIRRYIGSIVSDKFKDTFLWHEKRPSPLIYLKPFNDCFELLIYDDEAMSDAIEHVISRITLNPDIKVAGHTLKVEKVQVKQWHFNVIQPGKFTYYTRTPVFIGASKTEHAIYNSIKDDDEKVKEFITKLIKDSVQYQIKQYFDADFDIDDLKLDFSSLKHFTSRYYHGDEVRYHPSFVGDFTSNYSLPELIGYKFGLGHGHIVRAKKKERAA